MAIHPSAIVDPSAKLASDVSVGPFSYIGPEVEIGSGTVVHSHVVVKGPTVIGQNNEIFQFSSVGEDCQDKKFKGEPTRLIIGDNNIIRESCTIHRGTTQDKNETIIGSGNLLMAYVHVAHDCVVGNQCILANATTLAGHVQVDDFSVLGGGTMVHQFCKIGAYAMSAGGSIVLRDIPAFVMASGNSASAHGLNSVGMRRHGIDSDTIALLKRAYKTVYRDGLLLKDAIAQLRADGEPNVLLDTFVSSIERSDRGIIR